jgi:hypothetical protein
VTKRSICAVLFCSDPCWFPAMHRLADEVKMCTDLDKEAATLTQTLKERQEKLEKLKDLAAKQNIFLDLGGSKKT